MEKEEVITHKEKIKRLSLQRISDKDGLFVGTKSNGINYTVRADRNRYFRPTEWLNFISAIKEEKRMIFETLLQTGGRIEEILNLKPQDFLWDEKVVILRVTKSKAKKGESKILGGRARSFSVSSDFIKKIRNYIKKHQIENGDKIFPITKQAVFQMFKRGLERSGLNSWEFSLHNIRKTSGMWLKTVQRRGVDLDVSEICMRLGHDHNTFLKHYGSPSIFTDRDRDMIVEIMGDIYNLR